MIMISHEMYFKYFYHSIISLEVKNRRWHILSNNLGHCAMCGCSIGGEGGDCSAVLVSLMSRWGKKWMAADGEAPMLHTGSQTQVGVYRIICKLIGVLNTNGAFQK